MISRAASVRFYTDRYEGHQRWYYYGMQATIDNAGRMVIPKAVREAAGLRPGDPLEVRYREGRIEIEPVVEQVRLVREGQFLVATAAGATTLTNKDVSQVLSEIRGERGGRRDP